MSEIKVGDLVMVVRGLECCGHHGSLMGMVGKVVRIVLDSGGACDACGKLWYGLSYDTTIPGGPVDGYRCIKIDPPARPESITNDEEITA